LKFTEIKISGLKNGNHNFHFKLNSSFLSDFSTLFFDQPRLDVYVVLNMSETMIKTDLKVKGQVELVCDRSDETFDYQIDNEITHFFKIGEEDKELSDELEVISKERVALDLDQLIYDTVALSIPAKRLHPKFGIEDFDSDSDGFLVYTSQKEEKIESETSDPRWSKLKELSSLQ